jgi:hypothetical protein
MASQMVAKVRLALAPALPEWLHACLYLDARGFTTGPIPYGQKVLAMGIDVFDAELWIELSDGRRATLPLGPNHTVAEIWADFRTALASLSIDVDVWEKPQEVDDTTPFSENTHDRTFDAEHAQRFHRIISAVNGAFEEFRSPFFGRTGIQFWWGGFDFCVLLFTGRHAAPPEDRGFILRYDLDSEHLNAGFWPGDDATPEPRFFAYLVPQPPGCAVAPIQPPHASWADEMGEWVLTYDSVRTRSDPRATLLAFLKSVYQVAINEGGWDAEAFRYRAPPRGRRPGGDAADVLTGDRALGRSRIDRRRSRTP